MGGRGPARLIVCVDLNPLFVGEPTALLTPFGSHRTLLEATLGRLEAAKVAPLVVTYRDLPKNQPLAKLLAGRALTPVVGPPTSTPPELMLAALEKEQADTAVIVDARAAFVSPRVLAAQLENHQRSGAELTLCPMVPRGLSAIVAKKSALARLIPIYAQEQDLDLGINNLYSCVDRVRAAFTTADTAVADELTFFTRSMLPDTADDVAEYAPYALAPTSEEYGPVFDQLSARLWDRTRSRARSTTRTVFARRPKVLFTHFNTSREPGATKGFEILLDHFDASAHEMMVVLPCRGELFDHLERHGRGRFSVRLTRFNFAGSLPDPFSDEGWADEVGSCATVLAEERPDVAFLSGFAPAMAVACRQVGIPTLCWVQMPLANTLIIPPRMAALWGRQAGLPLHDLLVASGRHYGKSLQAAFRPPPGRLAVVHYGVELEHYDPARQDPAAARARFGLPAGDKVVSMVGTLAPYKRPDLAIETFARVVERIPDARLALAGAERTPSGYEERLAAHAAALGVADRVHFLGFVGDVASVYAASDVLLHCCIYETFGMVMVEAMAMERPVVAVQGSGPSEIVVDKKTGHLVPWPGTADALADALVDLLADPARRAQVGAAARAHVTARFSAQVFAKKMQELCLALVRGEPPVGD